MNGLCVKTHKSKGEVLRTRLIELGFYDKEREIVKDGNYLYIPINNNYDFIQISDLEIDEMELLEYDCPEKKSIINSYRDLLKDTISHQEFAILPRSFDTIGQVAVIKLTDELDSIKSEIGNAIISANKHIKTVYRSFGIHTDFRVLELELIAGLDDPKTVHTEFGINLLVDVKKVYFSPRLATERYRIASMVEPKEKILDMFAGVGPFSIMISRLAPDAQITAIDINPDAVALCMENIKKNSVSNIDVLEGDAKDIVFSLPEFGNYNRIIMNLPHSALDFLPVAFSAIGFGGIIHYYEIMDNTKIEPKFESLQNLGKNHNAVLDITGFRTVHTYSPSESLIGFDIVVKKTGQ